MFFEKDPLENKIERIERQLQELLCRKVDLDRQAAQLFEEIGVTPDQIQRFISNPDHFSAKNWAELQEQSRLCDQKLARDLENIIHPQRTQKKYLDRKTQPHWLFVR